MTSERADTDRIRVLFAGGDSKILVCSAVTITGIVRYLLRLGISAYVFESIDPRALVLAIRTVASGGTVFSEAILR